MKTLGGSCLILFYLFLASCDKSTPLEINEHKTYEIGTNCGSVKVIGSTFSKSIFLDQDFEGEFDLNLDSLNVQVFPSDLRIETMELKDEEWETVDERDFQIKEDKITLHIELNQSILAIEGLLVILHCSYIKCNGTPLIQDTIKVKL